VIENEIIFGKDSFSCLFLDFSKEVLDPVDKRLIGGCSDVTCVLAIACLHVSDADMWDGLIVSPFSMHDLRAYGQN
jgi:hypothetical protein